MINDLISAIEHNREPVVAGDDVLKVLRVIDALYISASSGRREEVGASRDVRNGGGCV